MSYEILHFRGSGEIIEAKNMENDIQLTLEYIDDVLYGTVHKRELLRQALEEMGWRPKDNNVLKFIEGRGYQYKGFKNDIAIEANFSAYEFILEGLFRLQLGYSNGLIECGLLLLTSARSEKSQLGSSKKLVLAEVAQLHPVITLPVAVVLYDLGKPGAYLEGGEDNG